MKAIFQSVFCGILLLLVWVSEANASCKVMVEIAEDVWAEKTYPSPLCRRWGIAED